MPHQTVSRKPELVTFRIRRLDDTELAEVAQIERDSFADPWTETELRELLRDRTAVGKAGRIDGQLVAYLIYCLLPRHLEIATLGVLPDCRRCGIGTAMVERLLRKLTEKRGVAVTEIEADNLEAQRFFSRLGFVVSKVIDSTVAERYRFVFRHGWPLPGKE